MSVIRPSLFLIMQRFPECKDALRYMYSRDNHFKTLCNNYQICSEALHYWRESEHEVAPDRHREYLALLHEIEKDIRQHLENLVKEGWPKQRKHPGLITD